MVTITKSAEPVCRSEWLADGVHVNAAGANAASRRELDRALVLRAAVKVTDDRRQAQTEAAEFIDLAAEGLLDWASVREIGEIAAGRVPGRRAPADVTLFKSLGIGLEDVAFAQTRLPAGVRGRHRASALGEPSSDHRKTHAPRRAWAGPLGAWAGGKSGARFARLAPIA